MPRKKILWVCSWYPNKLEPFNGDFIQRHARAAAMYNDIHVLFIAPDTTGSVSEKETTIQHRGALTEQLIFFKKGTTLWGRIRAHYRWIFLYRKAVRDLIIKNGMPDLVHVHVPIKAGIMGLWIKRRYKIPFLVTEHWGIYNEIAPDNYSTRSRTFKFYTRQIFEKAAAFTSVSEYLAEGVNRLVVKKEYAVIPNVVDTSLFFYRQHTAAVFRFIHVSNMVPLKNTDGILRSFATLHRQYGNAELVMVGDSEPLVRQLAASLGLPDGAVIFRGEVPYERVAQEMQEANCLVLFSNIENSPCVIGEALCCGLPVIATKVGGIPELVEKDNSILVQSQDEEALTRAMLEMINEFNRYDRKAIAEKAVQRFSYDTVGRQLDRLYESTKKSNP